MCVCGGGGGTLYFVCCIGWAPASSVYPQKYKVFQPYPKISGIPAIPKIISADISIPKKYFPCFLFIKVWLSFFFLYNDCICNIIALNSFQQPFRFYFIGTELMHSRNTTVKTKYIKTSTSSTEGSNPDSYNTPKIPRILKDPKNSNFSK